MKKLLVILLAISAFAMFFSCEKEALVDVKQQTQEEVQPDTTAPLNFAAKRELDSLIRAQAEQGIQTSNGNSRFNVLGATNASQIPTGLYIMDTRYAQYYQHVQQLAGTADCSWTSYVNAMGMVARRWGRSYPSTYAQMSYVKARTTNSISSIHNWSRANEASKGTTSLVSKSSSDRFGAIKHVLNELNDSQTSGNPVIAITGIRNANYSCHPNDVNQSNSSNYCNWITSSYNNAHYVVIVAISWQAGGSNSYVYYYDPLASGQTLQSCNMTRFLDAMVATPYTSYRNFMTVKS